MEQLVVLASTEDAYIESLMTDIRNWPTCKNFAEDKEFFMWLSSIVNQIQEIKPDYVFSPTKCTAFLSKLHNEHMCFNIEQEFQLKKVMFNDPEGHKNYVAIFQEMIVTKLKLIDSHLSSKKVGSTQLYQASHGTNET